MEICFNDISNGWLNDWVVCPIGTFLTDASGKITTFSFNNAYQLFDKMILHLLHNKLCQVVNMFH